MNETVERNRFTMFLRRRGSVLFVALVCGVLVANMLFIGSDVVGVLFSILLYVSIGSACGSVLFGYDPLALRLVKGSFMFLILLTVSGVTLLYVNLLDEIASLVITLVWSAFFLLLYWRKSSRPSLSPSLEKEASSGRVRWISSAGLVGVFVCASYYLLWTSRTDEPMIDVWRTIPLQPFFMLMFMTALVLATMIIYERRSSLHLTLISVVSVLIEGVYYLVWFPSLYGDPLTTLGLSRYVYKTGAIYAWDYIVSNQHWMDLVKGRGYSVLVTQLTRLSHADIYWVHNVVIPLLWAVVVPFTLYEITCLLANEKTDSYPQSALFSAFAGVFLVPVLITWGANPTGNTLGFIFLFFSLPFILQWALQGGRLTWTLGFLAALASFMTHPLPGIFGIVFLAGAMVYREPTRTSLKILSFLGLLVVLPLVLIYAGGEARLENTISVQSFLDFEKAVLTFSMALGAVGLFVSTKLRNLNRQALFLLVSFFLLTIGDYYITRYGLTRVAYGPGRTLVISEFLLAPFVGLLIAAISSILSGLGKSHKKSAVSETMNPRPNRKSALVVVLVLIISLQSAVTVYQAYPRNEVVRAPSVYEMEAIYYINATAPRRYVVVSDPLFTNLALGLLGEDYAYVGATGGAFGIPDWSYPIQQYYSQMVDQPSLEVLGEALEYATAERVYFVVSMRDPKFNSTVLQMSEMLPIEHSFGDGKLYIFRYPAPTIEGIGPKIKVTFDDGAVSEEVESTFSYMVQRDVTYSIDLTGHSAYNVTSYPLYWVFKYLTVNNNVHDFDAHSDVNRNVLLSDLSPSDTAKIYWTANDEYPLCGWKDDSFKEGWVPYPRWSYKLVPVVSSEQAMLGLFGNFTVGDQEDYYHAKPANVSTDEFPYIMIRWRAISKVAVSYVYFDDGSNQRIIPFGSSSSVWTTTRVTLEPGKRISYVMIGLSDIKGDLYGTQTLFVDYVIICNAGTD